MAEEFRRSERTTKGKATPKYGTQEYHDWLKELTNRSREEVSNSLKKEDPVAGTSSGWNSGTKQPDSTSHRRKTGGGGGSIHSNATSLSTLKKRENELKVAKEFAEFTEKINNINRDIVKKEAEFEASYKEIEKLQAAVDAIPDEEDEEKIKLQAELKAKGDAYNESYKKFEADKKMSEMDIEELKLKRGLVKTAGEVENARIDVEADQTLGSEDEEEEDDGRERVLDWTKNNQTVVNNPLPTPAELEQCRQNEARRKAQEQCRLLEIQQQRIQDEEGFRLHQQRLREEEAEIENKMRMSTAVATQGNPGPTLTSYPINSQFLARQSHGKDLPYFSGNPEEWLTFKGAYERTNLVCGFSPDENLNRLQRCLKGDAAKFVQSLMTTPNNIGSILRTLEMRYGQPEFIIKAMTSKMRNIQALRHDRMEDIIQFGSAVKSFVTTLQALNKPSHLCNPILLEELELKMPVSWRIQWREWLENGFHVNDLSSFSTWLERKMNIVCALCPPTMMDVKDMKKDVPPAKDRPRRQGDRVMMVAASEQKRNGKPQDAKPRGCTFCSIIGHRIWDCQQFKESDIQERIKFVKSKGLCYRCLGIGHRFSECRSTRTCGKQGCNRKHHALIHEDWKKPEVPEKKDEAAEPENALHANTLAEEDTGRVLYKILPLTFLGPNGEEVDDFVFMDGGSALTILDNGIADKLGLQRTKKPFTFGGLGYTGSRPDSCVVELRVKSKYNGNIYTLKNVQTDDVTYLPQRSLSREDLKKYRHLQGLPLQYYKDAKPKLLLGIQHSDVMETIRRSDAMRGQGPIAAETKLGWVITGTLPATTECPKNKMVLFTQESDEELHQMVKRHFTTEDFGVKVSTEKPRSLDDKRAETIMQTTARQVDGKWEMGLLWRHDEINLPESLTMADRRLKSVEKRMDSDADFAKVYEAKIQEYLDKGFVRKLSMEEMEDDNKTWYLPHFGVTNPNKPGKFRLVFDAAAKSHGVSLNDKLLTGPDYVPSLLGILFRFRQRAVAFTGDISDMFHQVSMKKEDQSSQKFLWRGRDRDRKPDVMVMQVMVFGAACSPSCAQYVKNLNAKQFELEYPEAVRDIIHNHYVDDFLGCTDTVEEALIRQQQVYDIHERGGFRIVKWISNNDEFNRKVPDELRADGVKNLNMDNETFSERVLGMYWEPPEDKFTFKVVFYKIEKDVLEGKRMPTKREALALVMSVFDPIGFLALFTVRAKMILQETWRSKVDWDELLPESVEGSWVQWIAELHNIVEFRVPRCYSVSFSTVRLRQLHVFVDASESAFAAVAYVRLGTEDNLEVSLIAAKAKVAPLKPLSIPRMELQAAVMGTRLANIIKKEHDFEFQETYYWSDSRTVLCWIRCDGRRYQQFVAHRIGEIQETSEVAEWNWVSTRDNVADEATRNTKTCQWGPESRWVNGPDFLKKDKKYWPTKPNERNDGNEDDSQLELKREFILVNVDVQVEECPINISKFSSWLKLIRTTAYVLRAKGYWANKACEQGNLLVPELRKAEEFWWKWVQGDSYPEEMKILQADKTLKSNNALARLSPWIDEAGVLRMKGRIPEDAEVFQLDRNPVILHPKHPYTKLMIAQFHKFAGHHGMERVVNELRQRYCIPNIRIAVKAAWNECQKCKNQRARPVPPMMGNLPLARLQSFVHPFTVTGLDYFGPMEVTVGRRREKRYGALFTCLSTRAVHLEVAASLSTDSCLLAIRRFIARRGYPREIFSDNGTNFVGANNELRKALETFNQKTIIDEMTTSGISWHFIPPAAPHMGGSWERLVKAVKVALEATLKERAPREEVLMTLMTEAENTVNGRPLTHVSIDPEDLEALTPNHFLVGRTNNIPSWRPRDDSEKCIRKQWEQAQQLADLFWRRWVREYLPTLTKREKWFLETKPIEIGDIVILVDNNQPRNCWPKGRVVATFPGNDGQVRTVEVKTAGGTYKRPAVKVCVLDVKPQERSSPDETCVTGQDKKEEELVLLLKKICSREA